jgi:hypothetical protein
MLVNFSSHPTQIWNIWLGKRKHFKTLSRPPLSCARRSDNMIGTCKSLKSTPHQEDTMVCPAWIKTHEIQYNLVLRSSTVQHAMSDALLLGVELRRRWVLFQPDGPASHHMEVDNTVMPRNTLLLSYLASCTIQRCVLFPEVELELPSKSSFCCHS